MFPSIAVRMSLGVVEWAERIENQSLFVDGAVCVIRGEGTEMK